MTTRVLTGITTTGTPHLGNYAGAIRPAIMAATRPDVESFYFLADYHALIKADDPARIARSRKELAATWLACGLDPNRVTFYRQSDIPEIPQLSWLLTCVTAKGLLNRAHAYKAAVDRNNESDEDPDAGITAGLYMYPVLMAADILIFNAQRVPVGRDQIQHVEMARDIGQRFNHIYGESWRRITGKLGEPLTLPEVQVDEHVATLPGLDGRKMSKSYNNTIPLFLPSTELKKHIMSIVTDSRPPGEPKDVEGSHLFQLYRAFATDAQTEAMRDAFAEGIAWSDAKQRLFEQIETTIAPMRERYERLMQRPDEMEDILQLGAEKARVHTQSLLEELRQAVGLGDFRTSGPRTVAAQHHKPQKPPSFKQYREDGKFYFKFLDADGRLLLQSVGYQSPQDTGRIIGRLKAHADDLTIEGTDVMLDGTLIGTLNDAVIDLDKVITALRQLRED